MSEQNRVHRYISVNQVEELRDACHSTGSNLADRNEVLVVILADFGLRNEEATELKRSMFDLNQGELMLPAHVQKDYPTAASPSAARMEIDPYNIFGTERLLRRYFNSDWWQAQDGDYVFPSRQSERMSTKSVRNVIENIAVEADISPRRTDGEPSEPEEMHPHVFRHSLASYMLRDDETRLVDVRDRLRHRSIQTTERIYEHFQQR